MRVYHWEWWERAAHPRRRAAVIHTDRTHSSALQCIIAAALTASRKQADRQTETAQRTAESPTD